MFNIVTTLVMLQPAPAAAEYDFVFDTGRLVEVVRSDEVDKYVGTGWLDAAGNFVPNKNGWQKAKSLMGYGRIATPLNFGFEGTAHEFRAGLLFIAYEYRSGTLIAGYHDGRYNFVPEVGSTVTDFRNYLKDYRPGERRPVWNLPGYVYRKGELPRTSGQVTTDDLEAAKKAMTSIGILGPVGPINPKLPPEFIPPFPLDSRPGVARPVAASAPPVPIPPGVYEFVSDTDRWVELRRRYEDQEIWTLGRLDAAGNFILSSEYHHKTGPKPAGAPEAVLLNREDLGRCYEYRSGRLIQGRIDDKLNFVPEVGSKVIVFKDYKYGPGALPIWNLPGSFQKK